MAPTNSSSTKKKSTRSHTSSAEAVDAQLERYRSMRDFDITNEPTGASAPSARMPRSAPLKRVKTTRGLPFVIQKHAASHLHYDFRLGWAGVLKSWAVAKGPSFNPKDRRLAIQVEDHPMEYGGFEGIIPQGQYGGGTVMVWDHGTWWPQLGHENVEAGLRDGHLKFEMNGSKMKGKWALIRMSPHADEKPSAKPNWLLIKEHDIYERSPEAKSITEQSPNSAITGRSLDEIASEEDHIWNSNRTTYLRDASVEPPAESPLERKADAGKGSTRSKERTKSGKAAKNNATANPVDSARLAAILKPLPKEDQPEFISPQLALEGEAPPSSDGWLHELKLDGYRIQARKAAGTVQLLTRKGLDWTHRMPEVAAAVARVGAKSCTLDGEVVALGPDGNSSFADLQASFQDTEAHPLTYFVFDLLHLDGHSTRELPLRERKAILSDLLSPLARDEVVRLSEDISGDGPTIFSHACQLQAEGIVSKRADAPYRSSRTSDWLKSKCLREQEFVIAGYTLSSEGEDRIGSLLLGYYSGPKLIYAGRTGTGFTQKLKRDLLTRLAGIKSPKPAFDHVPSDAKRGATWVEPVLVAQVRFATWTADTLVRQAAFLGLRDDKPAAEVTREAPTVAPQPKHRRTSAAPSSKAKRSDTRSGATPLTAARHTLAPVQHANLRSATKANTSNATKKAASAGVSLLEGVRLTHPEKVLDPETGLTKQQLAIYYATVAERMLPHIADRPLSLVRCPEGAGKPCFFQKHVNSMLPPGIGSIEVPNKKTAVPEPYITLNTTEALVSLAQLGVLEVHPWGSTNSDLEHPDRLIFDLDPDESLAWPALTSAAAEVRKRLRKAGLESFLKLTGGKGLHIIAPIDPTLTWPEVKDLAHRFVLAMERDHPSLYLTKMTKSARVGKIYLDYLRNERGATAVAPYSPRARLGAHVSLPLPWSALKQTERPVYSVHDLEAWSSSLKIDPWKGMVSMRQELVPEKFDAP
jgi:bifunctional non-homologous end joining protein LigD